MAFLLVTRPLDEALELEKKLPLPVLKAPLLEIELIAQDKKPIAGDYTSLIVTSARSLTIFSEIKAFLKKPIWCVGAITALKAKSLGFETIYTADNSAKDLYQFILSKTVPEAEKFLHICGENLHFDMVENLRKEGYQADKIILYRAKPIKFFFEEVLKAFVEERIVMIPVFSRRTAETLATVLQLYKLESVLKKITLVSCTAHITEPLQKFKWRQIIIKQDLSDTTLTGLYRKMVGEGEMEMGLKKSWPLFAGTALISVIFSIIGLILLAPRLFPPQIPIDTQKIQQDIGKALKADVQSSQEKIEKQMTELAAQLGALKQEIKLLEQPIPAPAPPPLETPDVPETPDLYLKSYIFVGQLEEQIKEGKADPLLWQEMEKLLLELKVPLPEKLQALIIIPLSKQELIQELKMLAETLPKEVTPDVQMEKMGQRWFQKVEKYVGEVVITKAKESAAPTTSLPLADQILQALQNDSLDQIRELKNNQTTPENLKVILENADVRLQILDGLKTLKSLLLQLSNQRKK